MYKKCYSASILKAELEAVRRKVSVQETETSWDGINQGIVQLKECCDNGGCKFPAEMIAGIRLLLAPLNRAISSERSRLSSSAIELVTALLAGLGLSFAPLATSFLPTLIGLCARTNKVFTKRAKTCILAVIQGTQSPSLLPLLARFLGHKSPAVRLVVAEGVLAYLCRPVVDVTRARLLEEVVKSTSRDASADVRKVGRDISEAYKAILPGGIESFTKKRQAVGGTAASEVETRGFSRGGHQMAGRVRPVGFFQDQKNPGKPAERRVHPLHSELQRDVGTATPIAVPTQATAPRQGALRPPSQQVSSSTQSRNPQREVACPIVPTTQRPRGVGNVKATDENPRVGGETRVVLIPTVPLAETGGAEIPRAIPKTRPPPFKPTRGKRVVSKLGPITKPTPPVNPTSAATVRPPSPMTLRLLALKAECLALKDPSSTIDKPESRGLTLADLQTTAELRAAERRAAILDQKKTVRAGPPVTKGFKPISRAPSGEMKNVGISKQPLPPSPTAPAVPPPPFPPQSSRESAQLETVAPREAEFNSTTTKGVLPVRVTHIPQNLRRPYILATFSRRDVNTDLISTTPTGEPPVREPAHDLCHPHVAATASRCDVNMEPTSMTPEGEPPVRTIQYMRRPKTPPLRPIQCADLFSAPASSDKYVARRVSESLKRAPRMTYRPLRYDVEATPSPCGRVPPSTTPKTPVHQRVFANSQFPHGQHSEQFRFSPQAASTPLSSRFDSLFSSWTSSLDKVLVNALHNFVVS